VSARRVDSSFLVFSLSTLTLRYFFDDINLTVLSKETVHTNSPTQRPQREDIWKNVSRIGKRSVGLKSL
jgi:hypothetical protein